MSKKRPRDTTGYRLHRDRIVFSGGTVVRSIKYPLKSLDETLESLKLQDDFIENLAADDLRIRGEVNLNDYADFVLAGQRRYTLFDFWIDSLRAGIIWSPTPNKLIEILNHINKNSSPADLIWDSASLEIKEFFDKDIFAKNFILPKSVRSTASKNSFEKKLIDSLKTEYKADINASKLIGKIVAGFFNEAGGLILQGENKQQEFWLREFKIDKSRLESKKPKGELKDLTCFIVSEIVNLENNTVEDLIKIRIDWLERNSWHKKDYLANILGLTDNFNAFSNYFGKFFSHLVDKKINDIYDAFLVFSPQIKTDKNRILKSLDFLSEKAQKLGKPLMTNGWADYRSVFGGKLQSWFSNFENRDEKIKQQIEKLKIGIRASLDYFSSYQTTDGDVLSQIEEIKLFLNRLDGFLTKSDIVNSEDYQLFENLLGAVKTKINAFYQKYLADEENIAVNQYRLNKIKIFAPLYERVYKPTAFYGQSVFKNNDKFVNQTFLILDTGLDIIFSLLTNLRSGFSMSSIFAKEKRKDEKEEDFYRNYLSFFWEKHKTNSVNSLKFQQKYSQVLKETSSIPWEKLLADKQRFIFYKSRYAKGTQKLVALRSADFLGSAEKLTQELTQFLLGFEKKDLFEDPSLLVDFIELSKKIIALVLRFNIKFGYEIKKEQFEIFEKAKRYLSYFGLAKATKREFGYIVNSLIFSEIKGAATAYSKKEYLAKYTIQVINSDEKFKLFLKLKDYKAGRSFSLLDPALSERKKYVNSPHIYLIAPRELKKDSKTKETNLIRLGKKQAEIYPLRDDFKPFFFKIASSYYQIQFLDKFIFRPKGWENVGIELSEWSFVLEKKYDIDWDRRNRRSVLIPSAENKPTIFVSIPFVLSAEAKEQPMLKIISPQRDAHPILGVDVGEYGLAWCLTKFGGNRIDILDQGFIEDRNIAAIKDNFSVIQQKARRGIFNASSDTVAEVRKNAVGGLRNKIHAILTTGKSSIVYEFSISNFETGSGRTTKIYNSVKKADVYGETDADRNVHDHVWGKRTRLLGTHLSAYASSYTCHKCKKSLYEINRDDLEDVEIKNRDGNIIYMETTRGEICGYAKDKSYKPGYKFKNTKDGFKGFKKIVSDFARPPQDSEVLLKIKRYRLGELKHFVERRGNSAIFVCPFSDCLNETDADIQAALMMAVRGYLRFKSGPITKAIDDETKERSDDLFKQSLNFLGQVIAPIEIKLAL